MEKQPTQEQIVEFIATSERLVAKSLYTLLIEYLPELADTMVIPETSGCIKIAIAGYKESLVIGLAVVPKDYVAEIAVPTAECGNDLYAQYNLMKATTITFWNHWKCLNGSILELLRLKYPGNDFETIHVDQAHQTSMYLVEEFPKRIGLIPCYIDKKGRPITK